MSTPCFAVELVTFDVGGTLLTFRPELPGAMASLLTANGFSVDEQRLADPLEREWPRAAERRAESMPADHSVTIEAGERRRWTFFENVLRQAGVSEPDLHPAISVVKAAFDSPEMYIAYDDALPTLRTLWERGLKLAAIANSWPTMPRVLLALGFGDYLGYWLISENFGVEKPHPAIFEQALEIGAAEPARALHVGDDYARDVLGARGVGMEAVLLDRSGNSDHEPDERTPVIRGLAELCDLIP